jgi:cell division protein FtsI/penicillin-binding protein 2
MSMDARSGATSVVKSRIGLAAGLCAAAFGIIVVRLVEVMVFGASLAVTADADTARQPMRADFVDRNGVLVARDLPVSDLYATPSAFWDTDEAARGLAKATGADEARLKGLFSSKHGYVLVRRGLTPDLRDAAMRLGLPGLNFEKSYRRYYPAGRTRSAKWTPTTTACPVSNSGSIRRCAAAKSRCSSRSTCACNTCSSTKCARPRANSAQRPRAASCST